MSEREVSLRMYARTMLAAIRRAGSCRKKRRMRKEEEEERGGWRDGADQACVCGLGEAREVVCHNFPHLVKRFNVAGNRWCLWSQPHRR